MRGQANGVEDRRPRGDDHEADDDEEDSEEEEEEEGRHRGQGQGQGQGQGPPQQQRRHQQAQRPSSGPQQQQQQHQPPPLTRNVGYVGKHRLSAAIARLDQELQSLQQPRPVGLPGRLLARPSQSQPPDTHLLPELCAIQILPACCILRSTKLHDSKHRAQCPNCALRSACCCTTGYALYLHESKQAKREYLDVYCWSGKLEMEAQHFITYIYMQKNWTSLKPWNLHLRHARK